MYRFQMNTIDLINYCSVHCFLSVKDCHEHSLVTGNIKGNELLVCRTAVSQYYKGFAAEKEEVNPKLTQPKPRT